MHSPCFTCEIWRLAPACFYGTSCLAFSSQLKRALCLHWAFLRGCAGLEGRKNLGSQRQQDSKEAQLQHQGSGPHGDRDGAGWGVSWAGSTILLTPIPLLSFHLVPLSCPQSLPCNCNGERLTSKVPNTDICDLDMLVTEYI